MKTGTAIILGVLGIVVFVGLMIASTLMGTYNTLVQKNVTVDESWSNVETQYQRRVDLIPGLVNSTKGFMKQEQAVFGAIAEARTHYAGAQTSNEKAVAAGQVETALSRLMVIMENYPDLKSSETVRRLTDELAGTANRVTIARDRYNAEVSIYNKYVKAFPTNVIAGMFGYSERAFFKSDAGSSVMPEVELL